jgi:hypothetical protein
MLCAANGLVSDRFLLTTAFNLHFTKPMRLAGRAKDVGFGQAPGFCRRADHRPKGKNARGNGHFMRSIAFRRRLPRLMAEASSTTRSGG